MSAIAVRLLTAADAEVLARVDPDVFDAPVRAEWAVAYLARPHHLLAVAIDDGLVVGMASGIEYLHPDKPLQLFINEVGVSDRWQGRGLGKRLMHALLDEGRRRGCIEAWVATEVDNTAARALYSSVGGTEDQAQAVVYTWPLVADATPSNPIAPPEENHS